MGEVMRWMCSVVAATVFSAACATAALASPQEDFARQLQGPWGRVDISWQPYSGVLAKNSCPALGVTRPSSVGLFGEGGSLWIEPDAGGSLKVHDGGTLPKTYLFIRMETGSSAVYSEAGMERRLSLAGPDRLSEERLPAVPGQPGAKFLRCKKKKA